MDDTAESNGYWYEWGVAATPLPGEAVSGDAHLVQEFQRGLLAAVVDGLGHSEKAAKAARTAIETLRSAVGRPLTDLIKLSHDALQRTRGAVMSLAQISAERGELSWLGVGNVEGVLLRGDRKSPRESMLLRGGVVGFQVPTLRASTLPIRAGDTLVLASDGIRSEFSGSLDLRGTATEIAKRIMANHARGNDDALVLVVKYKWS